MLNVCPLAKKECGFSLIETAVLITVLSFILVPLFIYLQSERVRKQAYQQENVNDRVLSALSLYLQQTGRYPCPADASIPMGNANFGKSRTTTSAGLLLNGDVYIGAVPVKELNISVTDSINKEGFRYIYAVSREKCVTRNDGSPDRVIIQNAAGVAIGNAAFAIVNVGQDGKGAWNLYGNFSGVACAAAAFDSENCDGDNVFRDGMFSVAVLPDAAGYYDDTLVYSLATNETTMWKVKERVTSVTPVITVDPGKIDIVTRSSGALGIGTQTPTAGEKLEVFGGNMQVMVGGGGTGGTVTLDGGNVQANQNVNGTLVQSDTSALAPVFYYDGP